MTVTPSNISARSSSHRMVASICVAASVLPMTFSGGAIALPELARSFGQDGPALQWVVNAFMLVFGALPLVAGALADRFGRRRVFRFGLWGFLVTGIALPLSPSLLVVDLLRAAQGLFAAATLAGGTALLAQLPDPLARQRAFSLIGATFGLGLALGPVLAGIALRVGGWPVVFIGSAGLAALALLLGVGVLQESHARQRTRFDTLGAVLFAASLAALTGWAVLLPDRGAGDAWVLGLLVATVLGLIAFVAQERRHPAPMFDLSLLQDPAFLGVQALPIATCFGFVSMLVILPVRMIGLGYSELGAGLICLPLSVPVFAIPLFLSLWPVTDRRRLASGGLALAALGLLGLATTPTDGALLPLIAMLSVIGIGVGLPWGVMDGLAIEVAPREKAGIATGFFSTVRVASEGIVLALISAGLVVTLAQSSGAQPEVVAAVLAGTQLPEALAQETTRAYRLVFLALALLTGLSAWVVMRSLNREAVR